MKTDRFGVPILDRNDLERIAETFLSRYAAEVLEAPRFTPLGRILQELKQKGLTIDLSASLGLSPEGHRYLGSFEPTSLTIRIDQILLQNDPRFPFTVAHELGHFLLHRNVDLLALDASGSEIRDTTRHLALNRVDAGNPRSFVEWQANRFATGILLPRRTVANAIQAIQIELGISRNLGTIWIDASDSSREDYRETVIRLAALYQASRAVVRYRLDDLGFLREFRSNGGGFSSLGSFMEEAAAESDEDEPNGN